MSFPFNPDVYWSGGAERTTQRDAYIVMRVFVRLAEIIEREIAGGDRANAWALCRICGRLQYEIYGGGSIATFEQYFKEEQEELEEVTV